MNTRTRAWRRGPILALGAALALGCAVQKTAVAAPEAFAGTSLKFVEDGKTTREEALLNLGHPSTQFEDGRILTYPLRATEGGDWRLIPSLQAGAPGVNVPRVWDVWLAPYVPGTASLVLVFREDGVLARHSLVVAK